jgi:hypothetical protein
VKSPITEETLHPHSLRSQYDTARLAGSLQKARNAIQGFGQSVKNLGEQIGEVFKPTPTPVNE